MKIIAFALVLLSSPIMAFGSWHSNSLPTNPNNIGTTSSNPIFDFLGESSHDQSTDLDNSLVRSDDMLTEDTIAENRVAVNRDLNTYGNLFDSSFRSVSDSSSDDSSIDSTDLSLENTRALTFLHSYYKSLHDFEQLKLIFGIDDTQDELKNLLVEFYEKVRYFSEKISPENIEHSLETNKEATELFNRFSMKLHKFNCNSEELSDFRNHIIDDLASVLNLIVDLFPDNQNY